MRGDRNERMVFLWLLCFVRSSVIRILYVYPLKNILIFNNRKKPTKTKGFVSFFLLLK